MRSPLLALGLAAAFAAASSTASSETLSPADTARLARERSPGVARARSAARVARALVDVASARPDAGSLELLAGPRHAESRTHADAEAAVEWPLDSGARRSSRVAAAEAAARVAELELLDAERLHVAEALELHARALHASAVERLASERLALARELLEISRERERVGASARFDVNVAEMEVALAESELAGASAAPATARSRLAVALGLEDAALDVAGSLEDRAAFLPPSALGASSASAEARADVQAARAEVERAEATVSLAQVSSRPPVALRVAAMREEESDALQAGVVIPLATRAKGRAEAAAAAFEREAAKEAASATLHAARSEIGAALASRDAADRAAALLHERALPLAHATTALVQDGWAAGKFDLAQVLLVRRDALNARREHLDRLLDAALADIALGAALGQPPPGDTP